MPTFDEFAKGQRDQVYANPDVKAGSFDLKLVEDMFLTLSHDRAEYDLCHDYFEGKQLLPYAPRNASAQIRDLQKRSIANWIPLLVNLPSQMSFVDDYRRRQGGMLEKKAGKGKKDTAENTSTEWRLWQKNRMDGRQAIVYRSVLQYGHAFVCVNNIDPKNITYDILSTRNTVAYFRDPVNDIRPSHVLTIKSYPRSEKVPGLAILWDDVNRWEMTYTFDGKFVVKGKPFQHKLEKCPIVRYTCFIDDEGRTRGVVLPAIPLQDRLNQATFSTNVTADFGAFKVRWAAGLMPSFKKDENGEMILDANGEPVPEPIEVSQSALLLSDDPATKFGQLDETDLRGYIQQEEQAARNFTTLSQFPPLASIANLANLSAEAWSAAEAQFIRWIDSLHISLGESHEELMRLGALASGDADGADSYGGEVRWRDMSTRTVAVMMDALGKAAQMLDVPRKGLWPMIPGVTNGMLDDWDELHEQQVQDMMEMDPLASQARAAGAQKVGPKPTSPNGTQKKPLSGNAGG
ncbi:MAG TPA: phage portal protein [Arthrobacter sp.]